MPVSAHSGAIASVVLPAPLDAHAIVSLLAPVSTTIPRPPNGYLYPYVMCHSWEWSQPLQMKVLSLTSNLSLSKR